MDIKQAVQIKDLQKKDSVAAPRRTARQLARKIFAAAQDQGNPFKNTTAEQWAKKWLQSEEFVLVEIGVSKAALPCMPKNPALVDQKVMQAAADREPIIVDLNKQGIGMSGVGYVPKVIVVDGKHRTMAAMKRNDFTIMAWVGVKALAAVLPQQPKLVMTAAASKSCTKLDTAAALARVIPRQDREQGNSAPHNPMPGMKGEELYNGSTIVSDPSDELSDPSNEEYLDPRLGKKAKKDYGAKNSSLATKLSAEDYVGKLKTKKKRSK